MKHSIIGASSAGRWTNCPGSVALCAQLPKKDPGPYAAEGTLAHDYAEYLLAGTGSYVVGSAKPDMVEHVGVYVNAVTNCCEAGPARELHIEQSFNLDWLYPGLWGTNDACVAEAFGTLYVWDFKYGVRVVVEVENNPQLMYYALGALKEFDYDFDKVCIGIVQPRAFHPKGPVRTWTISVKELLAWGEDVLKPAAIATSEKDAPLIAGDWCTKYFCPAIAHCPKMRSIALEMAKAEFSDDLEAVTFPAAGMLSSEDTAKLLTFFPLMESYAKEVKAHANEILEKGGDLPGYKLVDSYGNRAWKDKDEAEQFFKARLGDEVYDEPKFKSPAQIEKIACEDKKVLKEMVNEYVHKPYKGRIIAPESDKRPESKGTAAIDFKD